MKTIKVYSIKQFFQAQKELQSSGYTLDYYDEYFGYEVWQAGSKQVKLQMEGEY